MNISPQARQRRRVEPPPVVLAFGEWLPDLGEYDNPGAAEAKNVIAEPRGYSALRDLETFSSALTGPALGAFWSLDNAGNKYNFAGDATKLYEYDATSLDWDDVSKAGGYTSAGRWEFARFGERVIAVDKGNDTQYFDAGTSSLFADLPNAPKASTIGVVRDFVVLGDIDDGTNKPQVVSWSGFNNTEQWATSRPLQSDEQQLQGRSGKVQRIVPGQVGYIFTQQSVWRMSYVGPPVVFRFDEVLQQEGTPAAGSVCWGNGVMFWYSYDGFRAWSGEGAPQRIGSNKIDAWFQQNADEAQLSTMQSVVDRVNGLVLWAFRRNSQTVNDTLLIFNARAGRWTWAEVDTQVLAEYTPQGYTLDGLDTILTDIDTDSFNVDSPIYAGREIAVLAFNGSNQAAQLTGDPLPAQLTTRRWESGGPEGLYRLQGVESLVEGTPTAITAQVGTSARLNNDIVWTSNIAQSARGRHDLIRSGRIFQVRLNITGLFDRAYGVRMRGVSAGGV